ncbi:MAG: hypothetical protein ACC631_10695, partial [Halocynthiibacter sp.]
LLAEAFPTLNAQELQARLLASADNSFFNQTAFIEFAPGILHGYNQQFGHGFLDLRAALLPIGSSYVARSSGERTVLNGPVILGGGMVGDALSARLARRDIVVVDGLGTGFDMPASVLTASVKVAPNPAALMNELLAVDLTQAGDPFDLQDAFSAPLAGQKLDMDFAALSLSVLLPDQNSAAPSFGLALSRDFDLGGSNLRLGLSSMREAGGFVGIQSMTPGQSISARHAGVTFDWGLPLAGAQQLRLSGSFGVAAPQGSLTDVNLSPVQYNSLRLSYGANNFVTFGDRLSLAVGLPQAVAAGSADFILPVSRSNGSAVFETTSVALSPTARQLDLTLGYGVPLSRFSDVLMSVTQSLNAGNIAGQSGASATIGWRYRF